MLEHGRTENSHGKGQDSNANARPVLLPDDW
jgi:hypothetical protein